MKVLNHHIYEYKKGLRNLVLHTMKRCDVKLAEERLFRQNISFHIQPVTANTVNIYFGKEECVKIIKLFGNKSLSNFSPEEDFILGTMLGYDRMLQCQRFIQQIWLRDKKQKQIKVC